MTDSPTPPAQPAAPKPEGMTADELKRQALSDPDTLLLHHEIASMFHQALSGTAADPCDLCFLKADQIIVSVAGILATARQTWEAERAQMLAGPDRGDVEALVEKLEGLGSKTCAKAAKMISELAISRGALRTERAALLRRIEEERREGYRKGMKDAREDAKDVAAEQGWKDRQGDDYGSY